MSKLFKTIAATSTPIALEQIPVNQNGGAPAKENTAYNRLVIRDMIIPARIGAFEFERREKQPLRINIIASVTPHQAHGRDMVNGTMSCDEIISEIQFLAANEDLYMLENFAENIARFCLSDKNVRDIQVRVEKTKTSIDAQGIGVEIYRAQSGA